MPLSVSFYVRVFLTGKNKNFSSRACIYALHLLNICVRTFLSRQKNVFYNNLNAVRETTAFMSK